VSEIGKYRMATINDIRQEDENGDLSKEDLKNIESFCLGKFGNDFSSPNLFNDEELYGKYRALVLDIYFYSYDEEVTVARRSKDGNPRMTNKPFDYYKGKEKDFERKYSDRRLYRTTTQNVYKASWIVGSDYIWNFGLVKNISRPSTDIFRASLPISLICPNIKNGQTTSVIEEMIAVTERANILWIKMEDAIAKARPTGFTLDVPAFVAATVGLADQGYTFQELVRMAREENIIFTDHKAMAGVANGAKSFTELWGGLGPEFSQYYEGIQQCIQLLQEISGFSGAATGTPEKYTGKKVAELAVASADYSIKHLFRAKKTLYENTMQSTSRLLLDSIMYGESEVLRHYIGDNAFDFIKQNANAYECMLMIEFRPTKEEWSHIYEAAGIAIKTPLEQGGITYPDYLRVVNCETIEEAEYMMRLLHNRNIKKYERSKQQDIAANGEQQRLSAEQASLMENQRLQAEIEHERQMVAIKTQDELDLKHADFLYKMQEKKIEGLIKGDQINTQGSIDKEITGIQAKYNMDRMKQKEKK
jgi:hypothetical protein